MTAKPGSAGSAARAALTLFDAKRYLATPFVAGLPNPITGAVLLGPEPWCKRCETAPDRGR